LVVSVEREARTQTEIEQRAAGYEEFWRDNMIRKLFGIVAATAAAITFATLSNASVCGVAEIKVFASAGVRGPLDELTRQFQAVSGHRVATDYEVTAVLQRKIDAGGAFDVAVLNPQPIDELIKLGKIAADTRTNFGRTGLAVAVRRGAPKPDVGSSEAFKRSMLNAKSVAHSKEGLSGAGFLAALARLGIVEEMRPRLRAYDTDGSLPAVASGEAELVVIAIGPILAVPEVELVGMLPAELQTCVAFTAGVSAAAREPQAARSLIQFLAAPAAVPVMKAKGLEPY
jgi:molybdate transport system substrate-binding protein